MAREIYRKIIELVLKAAELARSIGITSLLQPGLVKEMIIADILGHELIHSKREADAHAQNNPAEKYEYLSCKEGGTGQLDRMFKEPADKRAESLSRITRNKKVYFAIFYAANQTKCKVIYEIEPQVVVEETERQLDRAETRSLTSDSLKIGQAGMGASFIRTRSRLTTGCRRRCSAALRNAPEPDC